MSYLNENGLARYDGLIKNWVTLKSGTVDGVDPLLNWQKTEAASSVAFYPLPAAPLDLVATFAFTETDPAEGEKSPTNPSAITGVSSIIVTRCETVGVDSTDYTIDLGGTFYGGSVDLSAGTMTVTWVGESVEAFSNTSLVGTNTVAFRFDCSYAHGAMSATTDELVCDKFVSELGDGDSEHCRFVGSANYDNMFIRFYISKSRLDVSSAINPASPTDAEWRSAANAWLSSNPVFISYKINNPFAVQLTPLQIYSLSQLDPYTPRINTVYSDQTSVQVGYPKSPLATATELTNAIISLGGEI